MEELPAPGHPSSGRGRKLEGPRPVAVAIPSSARAPRQVRAVPRVSPRWVAARPGEPRVRPRFPDRALRAKQPANPRSAIPREAPRRSEPSGLARGRPWQAEPRSKQLPLSGLPALPGEPVARTSSAYGACAAACRGFRRPAPSAPGLCMRIQPTSGGEPPLRRFRPEISDVRQQSRSEEVWHPGYVSQRHLRVTPVSMRSLRIYRPLDHEAPRGNPRHRDVCLQRMRARGQRISAEDVHHDSPAKR